jgi:hypothetical protein
MLVQAILIGFALVDKDISDSGLGVEVEVICILQVLDLGDCAIARLASLTSLSNDWDVVLLVDSLIRSFNLNAQIPNAPVLRVANHDQELAFGARTRLRIIEIFLRDDSRCDAQLDHLETRVRAAPNALC